MLKKIKTYGFSRWLRLTKSTLLKKFYYVPIRGSFSQYGEDIIIDDLLGGEKTGFYVDVGAFDPDLISNTKRFYMRGWRGIIVEPNPEKFKKFLEKRPEDASLNMGVSNEKGEMTAYRFTGMASFTFVPVLDGQRAEDVIKIEVDTLANILRNYASGKDIDFISIDTEGLDLKVLRGNDWDEFRPRLVCVESYNASGRDYEDKITKYLSGVGYKMIYDNGLNSFYMDARK